MNAILFYPFTLICNIVFVIAVTQFYLRNSFTVMLCFVGVSLLWPNWSIYWCYVQSWITPWCIIVRCKYICI